MPTQRKNILPKVCLVLTTIILLAAYIVGKFVSEQLGWQLAYVSLPTCALTIILGYINGYHSVGKDARN